VTWGVFARYVLRDPDGMVTEATALLLVPLAYVGIAYALQEDAFPKVTMIVEKLPPTVARWVNFFNLVLMTVIGGFFTLVAGSATIRLFQSRAVSSIIEWPEFAFWGPVAFFFGVFTLLGVLKCAIELLHGARS
jgi:TRAP-type C4-dicarboxylate transport system permease small subunit